MPRTSPAVSLIPSIPLQVRYYCPHFANEETKAQRNWALTEWDLVQWSLLPHNKAPGRHYPLFKPSLYWVASQWGPWALIESIQTRSLGFTPGEWLGSAADGAWGAVVTSFDGLLGSELCSYLQGILDNAVPGDPKLHINLYRNNPASWFEFPIDLFSVGLEGFDAVFHFQCLLSFLKRARTV